MLRSVHSTHIMVGHPNLKLQTEPFAKQDLSGSPAAALPDSKTPCHAVAGICSAGRQVTAISDVTLKDLATCASVVGSVADVTVSPGESANGNKRKAPEDNFAEDEEVSCPCGAGPCALLTSTKPQSQGRKFYRCPKPKVRYLSLRSAGTSVCI